MGKIKGELTTSDYLPMDEFTKLINGLRRDKMYIWELYCCLSFCTAHRVSDVLTYKWVDVLGKSDVTKIEQKTRKTRTIPLNDKIRKKLSELYELLGKPDLNQYMIYNTRMKKSYSVRHINRQLKIFKVRYKLTEIKFSTHSFRKTFGRFVYEAMGKTADALIILCSIFKHSSIETTIIYIGLRKTEIDSAYKSLTF